MSAAVIAIAGGPASTSFGSFCPSPRQARA